MFSFSRHGICFGQEIEVHTRVLGLDLERLNEDGTMMSCSKLGERNSVSCAFSLTYNLFCSRTKRKT